MLRLLICWLTFAAFAPGPALAAWPTYRLEGQSDTLALDLSLHLPPSVKVRVSGSGPIDMLLSRPNREVATNRPIRDWAYLDRCPGSTPQDERGRAAVRARVSGSPLIWFGPTVAQAELGLYLVAIEGGTCLAIYSLSDDFARQVAQAAHGRLRGYSPSISYLWPGRAAQLLDGKMAMATFFRLAITLGDCRARSCRGKRRTARLRAERAPSYLRVIDLDHPQRESLRIGAQSWTKDVYGCWDRGDTYLLLSAAEAVWPGLYRSLVVTARAGYRFHGRYLEWNNFFDRGRIAVGSNGFVKTGHTRRWQGRSWQWSRSLWYYPPTLTKIDPETPCRLP